MSKIKTGGSAFPTVGSQYSHEEGMTLRDYFAAKALQGLCSHGGSSPITQKALAEFAYQLADAMIAERE